MNFKQPLVGWEWGGNRFSLVEVMCADKVVLHIGSEDAGVTGREPLHERIRKVADRVWGVDVVGSPDVSIDFQTETWSVTSIPSCEHIDIVVCTEVLEHLDSVGPFLKNLRTVGADEYLFTVPNAFSRDHYLSAVSGEHELVHPDHRCWFSPYTLENVLRRAGYTPIRKLMVGFTKQTSKFTMEGVAILCR